VLSRVRHTSGGRQIALTKPADKFVEFLSGAAIFVEKILTSPKRGVRFHETENERRDTWQVKSNRNQAVSGKESSLGMPVPGGENEDSTKSTLF